MPYTEIHHADGTVSVINRVTGKVHAKRTTPEKASAQIHIMEQADRGEKAMKSSTHNKKKGSHT